jgi:hypothetical protein
VAGDEAVAGEAEVDAVWRPVGGAFECAGFGEEGVEGEEFALEFGGEASDDGDALVEVGLHGGEVVAAGQEEGFAEDDGRVEGVAQACEDGGVGVFKFGDGRGQALGEAVPGVVDANEDGDECWFGGDDVGFEAFFEVAEAVAGDAAVGDAQVVVGEVGLEEGGDDVDVAVAEVFEVVDLDGAGAVGDAVAQKEDVFVFLDEHGCVCSSFFAGVEFFARMRCRGMPGGGIGVFRAGRRWGGVDDCAWDGVVRGGTEEPGWSGAAFVDAAQEVVGRFEEGGDVGEGGFGKGAGLWAEAALDVDGLFEDF